MERLRRDGVRTDHVDVVVGRATAVAFVAYAADGSRTFIFHWDGTPAVMAGVPSPDVVDGARYFHVMGCSMMANAAFRQRLIDTVELFAEQRTWTITFDPNIRTELVGERIVEAIVAPILGRCSILLPRGYRLQTLGGTTDLDRVRGGDHERSPAADDRRQAGPQDCRSLHPRSPYRCVAFDVLEVDPTGAGD